MIDIYTVIFRLRIPYGLMLDERCRFCGWHRGSAAAGSLLAQWSWKRSVLLHLKAEWMGSRTESVVLVLCKEKDRKIGPGYVPRSFVSNLLHYTSLLYTDTSPVPSAGLQHGGVAQEEHSVPVCVTLCIYTEQLYTHHDVIITYIHMSLAYMFIHVHICIVQNFYHTCQSWMNYIQHIRDMNMKKIFLFFCNLYKMYV